MYMTTFSVLAYFSIIIGELQEYKKVFYIVQNASNNVWLYLYPATSTILD